MTDAYDEDLAYIHDVGWGSFATESAPRLLEMLRRAEIDKGLVVDLGCGSGLWAAELIRQGYDVLGVDVSGAMLRIARRRAPRGQYVRSSFLDVKFPSCAAVTALGEVFNYLFDGRNGLDKLEPLFERAHAALLPGGIFIFDVATPGRAGGKGPLQRNFLGDGWALMLETEEHPRERLLTRRITTFRRVGKAYRRGDELHRVRLFQPRDIAVALRRCGFQVHTLRGYGARTFARGVVGFVARKARK